VRTLKVVENQSKDLNLDKNMLEEVNTSDKPLAGEQDVDSSDGKGADSEAVSVKDVLNKYLGKDFKDDETALKAVKDTFSHVGKVGKYQPLISELEDKFGGEEGALKAIESVQDPEKSGLVTKEKFDTELFYRDKPEYQPYRKVIDSMAKSEGNTPGEVVETEEFKSIFEKVKAHDKAEESKSVLMSNPKIGLATDKISDAKKDLSEGKKESAEKKAVNAVINAFELDQQ